MRGRMTALKEMEYDNHSAWQRHAPWIIRLTLAVVLLLASGRLILLALSQTDKIADKSLLGLVFGSFVIFCAGFVFLLTSFGKMRLTWRAFMRSRGRFTKAEKMIMQERAELARAQAAAAELARDLFEGNLRTQNPPWEVVLRNNEQAICTANANYARFYGSDVSYMHSSGFLMGHPTLVAAGVLAMALGNKARRSQAEAMAKEQWREQQLVLAVITNQRVICRRQDGAWVSFDYLAATSMDVDSATGTMILQFPSTEPLMLGGTGGLYAAVTAIWAVRGPQGLERHPGLAYLRTLEHNQLN